MRAARYRIDLSRQMAGCDANYIRLLKLLPRLESYRLDCLHQTMSDATGDATGDARGEREYSRDFLVDSMHAPAGEGPVMEARVRIRVLEVFRYTSTLEIAQLNQYGEQLNQWVEPPSILIRVYHDAHAAEAVAYQGHRGFLARYETPNSRMYHQDEKRQINEFLGEWLSLCVQAGRSMNAHVFCSA